MGLTWTSIWTPGISDNHYMHTFRPYTISSEILTYLQQACPFLRLLTKRVDDRANLEQRGLLVSDSERTV